MSEDTSTVGTEETTASGTEDTTASGTGDTASGGKHAAHAAPRGVVKAIEGYVRRNGGSAKAVLQPIGGAGVRITLVAAEGGILGDEVVDDLDTATAVVDAVDGVEVAEWDRDLTSTATPAPGHWRKMAGWVANT